MLFRVTLASSRCLAGNLVPIQSSYQPQIQKRPMSKSLADEILQAKKEQEQKEKEKSDKPKYQPLTKWQKIGYIVAVVGIGGGLVGNAILFCKFLLLLCNFFLMNHSIF